MARGKMSGSPFHVESLRYKYAIEHENDDCDFKSKPVDCPHLFKKSKQCLLWNSGYRYCSHFKCRCIAAIPQRKSTCNSCAYFYSDNCFCPQKPPKIKVNCSDASFCCFYISEYEDQSKYHFLQRCCKRIFYTHKVNDCLKKINSKDLYVRQARKELNEEKTSDDDKIYLNRKIAAKLSEKEKIKLSLSEYSAILQSVGGPLSQFPRRLPKR